jgi:hypothetical protein
MRGGKAMSLSPTSSSIDSDTLDTWLLSIRSQPGLASEDFRYWEEADAKY